MLTLTPGALAGVAGSHEHDRLVAHAWYDGRVVAQDLPVESWSLSEDIDRMVRRQLSLTVRDPDGVLAPWVVDDPLGVGGARLQVIHLTGRAGERTPWGWFRITGNEAAESWRVYRIPDASASGRDPDAEYFGERVEWVSGGAAVPVEAEDLTRVAILEKLLAPQSAPTGATVLSEVRRLLDGIMPVTVADGVLDDDVPTSVVYQRERMDAVADLLTRIGCSHRMTGDGQLEVYPVEQTSPVWTVQGGDSGALITSRRSQRIDGLFNAAMVEGATDDGRPLVGLAVQESGPLAWGGPHGRVPESMSATGLLKTQSAVDAAAVTRLASAARARTIVLEVTCLPHPGVQTGDWVQVACPTVAGVALPVVGVVESVSRGGNARGVLPMTMSVRCDWADVQALASVVRRGR